MPKSNNPNYSAGTSEGNITLNIPKSKYFSLKYKLLMENFTPQHKGPTHVQLSSHAMQFMVTIFSCESVAMKNNYDLKPIEQRYKK